MTRQEAIDLFGGRVIELARAMNLTRSAIYEWPDELTQGLADRGVGAHVRVHHQKTFKRRYSGKPVPKPKKRLLTNERKEP